MEGKIYLNCWYILCVDGDCHLRGRVTGHPNHKDNSMIITSKIVKYNNYTYHKDDPLYRTVQTTSGRVYFLLKHRDLDTLSRKFGEKDWP